MKKEITQINFYVAGHHVRYSTTKTSPTQLKKVKKELLEKKAKLKRTERIGSEVEGED